jgi:hypothetical protein
MAEAKRLIRVFLASPSDLGDERRIARSVVEEVNSLAGDIYNCRIELVGWEDTVTVFGRPQATINRDLERCELFVGVMWKRWGTPPDTSGPYSSGFEEEFESSVRRRSDRGLPEISLFFKSVSLDLINDPGEELRKVLAFKDRLIREKMVLFEEFVDTQDFEKRLRRCLFGYLQNSRALELIQQSSNNQSAPEESNRTQTTTPSRLSPEGASFLREFIQRTESTDTDAVTATDVARFRLLSTYSGLHGNDELPLGVHDANLLFASREKFQFGDTEVAGLIRAGLTHLSSENAPLWTWIAPSLRKLWNFSISGSSEEKTGAIRAMHLVAEAIPDDFDRDLTLRIWLSDDSDHREKIAALDYLAEFGETSDLVNIREEIERNNSQTVSAASNAFMEISLRTSREDALRVVHSLQPSKISRSLLEAIFVDAGEFDSELLRAGLPVKTDGVRRASLQVLFDRGEITAEEAEELLDDQDRLVRRLAIDLLASAGRQFPDDQVKRLLTQQRKGLMAGDDETLWLEYRRKNLEILDSATLSRLREEESLFETDLELTYLSKNLPKSKPELRSLLEDGFNARFSSKLNEMERNFGKSTDFVVKTQSLRGFVTKGHTRKALELLCTKGNATDLSLVRKVLTTGDIDYSANDTEFLRKFGEWRDIHLIVSSLSRRKSSLLISPYEDDATSTAAKAIIHLGKHRLRELLSIEMPANLLASIVAQCPETTFSGLGDVTILKLLDSDSSQVRKMCALKCGKALPKRRIKKLLSSYVDREGHRYYNVIHWLDFSESLPSVRAKKTITRLLRRGG